MSGLALLAGLNQGVNAVGTGWNMFKDFNNIDNQRAEAMNKRLMQQQFENQEDLNYQAYLYNRLLQSQSNQFNVENMEKQYNLNRYLSSLGRNIFASRIAGINPAGGVSSGSGSVSLPTSNTPVSSSGSAAMSNYSHTAPVSQVQDVLTPAFDRISDINLKNSQSELNRISSITALEREKTNIMKMKSEAARNYAEAGLTKTEIDFNLKSFDQRVELIDKKIKYLEESAKATAANADSNKKQAEAALKQADVAQQNVDVRKGELTEITRHNQALEDLQGAYNRIYGSQVYWNNKQIEADIEQINARINEIKAHESWYKNDSSRLQAEVKWFDAKMMSILGVNDERMKLLRAQAEEAANRAGLIGKERDWYIFNNLFEKYMDLQDGARQWTETIMSVVPWFSRSNVARKAARRTMGLDARGRKYEEYNEWNWNEDKNFAPNANYGE